MAVSLKDVEHIARLARLEFSAEEKEAYTRHLNEIIVYIDQLNKLDTDNVEPLSHVIDLSNRTREDTSAPGLTAEEALRNAPEKTDQFFKVPKVIGGKKA